MTVPLYGSTSELDRPSTSRSRSGQATRSGSPARAPIRGLKLRPGIAVRHFHGLCADLVRQSGIKPPMPNMMPDAYARWLPTGLFEALDHTRLRFDAIVVDEGQDFEAEWLEYLGLLLTDETNGVFHVLYHDNQRLNRSDQLPAWLGTPTSACATSAILTRSGPSSNSSAAATCG